MEVVIEDPFALLATLSYHNTVRQRFRQQRRSNVTFQTFIRDILEPYLPTELGKSFQEAQGQLENFVKVKL